MISGTIIKLCHRPDAIKIPVNHRRGSPRGEEGTQWRGTQRESGPEERGPQRGGWRRGGGAGPGEDMSN